MTKKFKRKRYILFSFFLLNNPSFFRVVSAGTTCHHQIQVWRTVWYHRASKRTVTRLPETLWRPKAQYHQRWHRINQRVAKFLICTLTNFYGFARRKTSAFDSQRTRRLNLQTIPHNTCSGLYLYTLYKN